MKTSIKTGLLVFLSLNVLSFIYSIIAIALGSKGPFGLWHDISTVVTVIVIMLYVFVLYKKPHGNSLRYLYFFFGLCLAFHGVLDILEGLLFLSGCMQVLAALIITYISGRLDKIEKNRPLLILVGILLFISWLSINFISDYAHFSVLRLLGSLNNPIQLGALGYAYAARYEEHKAAGLS